MASISSSLSLRPTAYPLSQRRISPARKSTILPNYPKREKIVPRVYVSEEAPFFAAIGASILFSLVSPVRDPLEDDGEDPKSRELKMTDARFGVMSILSAIPYFNWMGWIFAWLDTGRQRYLVYSAIYLAPYIRTNLSISPDESLLPLASFVACIVHVQLEESIRNGDVDAIRLLGKTLKYLLPSKDKNSPPRR